MPRKIPVLICSNNPRFNNLLTKVVESLWESHFAQSGCHPDIHLFYYDHEALDWLEQNKRSEPNTVLVIGEKLSPRINKEEDAEPREPVNGSAFFKKLSGAGLLPHCGALIAKDAQHALAETNTGYFALQLDEANMRDMCADYACFDDLKSYLADELQDMVARSCRQHTNWQTTRQLKQKALIFG